MTDAGSGSGDDRTEAAGGRPPPAQAYRRFAEGEVAEASPLSARVALALSESAAARRAIEALPARRRQPRVVLAALHDLALAGRAPALAAAYAAGDAEAAARAAVDVLVEMAEAVAAVATRRPVRSDERSNGAVLHPAVALAARRAGAEAIGLVDVGCGAGLDLAVDRVGVTYSDGRSLGDPASPVQLTAEVVGDRPVPTAPVPPVVARIGVDRTPLDVTDPDDVRWLRACLWPDRPERRARLDAEVALLAAHPPALLAGDPVALVGDAVARVPAGALPVVTTTWALSALTPARRRRFLDELRAAAAGRPVAWVSVEGVGVAPEVPTLGDRPASGHSIVGVAVVDGPAVRPEAVGRCYGRGRWLAWLAGD